MFGIGASELVLIVIVALVVVGPKRLPNALRAIGRSLGEFRKVTRELRDEVGYDEVVDEVTKPLREGLSEVHEQVRSVQNEVSHGLSPKGLLGEGPRPAKSAPTEAEAAAIIAAKEARAAPTDEGFLRFEDEYPEGGADSLEALPETAVAYPAETPVYDDDAARAREALGPTPALAGAGGEPEAAKATA